jgi:tRNA threonylcarbamoyladenosine biosynthesis protein TsaB
VRILGLDTATCRASVGLLVDGEVVAELSQGARGNHAVSLLPLVDAVLRAAGCRVDGLDAVAVSSGPGSFTGLRIGMSVAKGLACATGARLVGVPTLEALARTVVGYRGVICPLLDARKGELYAACFESGANGWQRLTPDALVTAECLLELLPPSCVLLGDGVPRAGAWLRDRLGPGVTLLPAETHGPRGGVIASLGRERLLAGQSADVASLEPFYARPSEAEVNAS